MNFKEKLADQQKRLPDGFSFQEGDNSWQYWLDEPDGLIRFTVTGSKTHYSRSYAATPERAGWELAYAVDDARQEERRPTLELREKIRNLGWKARGSFLLTYRDRGRDALISRLKGMCSDRFLGSDCEEVADAIIDRTIWN